MPRVVGFSPYRAGPPAGGTTGQVLVKQSSADYDSAWHTAPAGPGPVHVVGQWYDNRWLGAAPFAAAASDVVYLVANQTMYVPVYFFAPVTIAAVAFQVVTSSALAVNLGVSGSTAAGMPGVLLGSAAVATSGARMYTVTLTAAAAVPAGWAYFSLGCNSNPQIVGAPAGGFRSPQPLPSTANFGSNPAALYLAAAVAPASTPTVTAYPNPYNPYFVPLVYYRVG